MLHCEKSRQFVESVTVVFVGSKMKLYNFFIISNLIVVITV